MNAMTHAIHKVVRHEGGWAYTVDGSYSETFPNRRDALQAARGGRAADGRPEIEVDDGK